MYKQSSTTLLIIFLLLSSSLYSSNNDTVLAFAHTNHNIHPYHKQLYHRQYIMQTRGGGVATRPTTKLSTSKSTSYDDDKTIKSAKQALAAIQYCIKMSFFSVLSNVVSKCLVRLY